MTAISRKNDEREKKTENGLVIGLLNSFNEIKVIS